MSQFVQIVGSLLVLTAFALGQSGYLDQKSRWYLVLNLSGSLVLAFEAVHGRLWGFLLLEGVWALVSAVSLLQTFRDSPALAGKGSGDHALGRPVRAGVRAEDCKGHLPPVRVGESRKKW